MSDIIPNEIGNCETLAHYLFDRNFKKKVPEKEKLISKDVFLPNKGGVSLQRGNYCNENKCKHLALKAINDRKFVGFYCFKKEDFEKVKQQYLENRPEFEAIIKSTPLNEDFEYLPETIEVTIYSPGNPAHADLIYLNPAIQENESPNTAIRSFSRKLSKVCKLLIDENPEDHNYLGQKFMEAV